jgi:hypothetical protein
MTREEVSKLLAFAKAATGMVVEPSTIAAWADMLEDIDADAAMAALRAFLAEDSRRPSIADIRKRATAKGRPVDAGQAWDEVQRAISRHGRTRSFRSEHPSVQRAVDAIGWIAICDTNMDDVPTLRAQFERYLKGFAETMAYQSNVGQLEEHRQERLGQVSAGAALSIARRAVP